MISRLALMTIRQLYKAVLRRNIWLQGMCPYHGIMFAHPLEQHYDGCTACQRSNRTHAESKAQKAMNKADKLFEELERLP